MEKKIEIKLMAKGDIIHSFIPNIDNKKIIDIGSGVSPIFGDKSTNVDKTTLAYFKKKLKDDNFSIPNYIEADAHALPFENGEFDYAILSEILEHVDEPIKVLDEAQRVAAVVIATVPNEYQWSDDKKPFTNKGHVRYFTEETLHKLVVDSGLHILEFIKVWVQGWCHFILVGISKYTIGK